MTKWKIIDIPEFYDKKRNGILVAAEIFKATEGIFNCARRIYFIVNAEDHIIERGGHYHPCNEELWVVPVGWVVVELHGKDACGVVRLVKRTKALLIPSNTWHGVQLSPGAILVSLASENYSAEESISEKPLCRCMSQK